VVRPFPRTPSRLAVAAGATALLLGASGVAPFAHADNLKHRQHRAHTHVRIAQHDLDESSHALNAADARLQVAQRQLSAAQARLGSTRAKLTAAVLLDRQMQARLEQAQRELADARAAVARGKREVVAQRTDIGRLAAASYSYGDPDLMGVSAMLSSTNTQQVTSQMLTVDSLMNRETAGLRSLKATEALLVAQKQQVAAAERQVAARRADAARQVDVRRQLEQQAVADRNRVAAMVASRRAAQRHAEQVKAHDRATLKRLQAREERIKRLILARARHQRNHRVANTGGLLYRPVPGYVTSPYGWRIHPIYHYWGLHDGDDFHAPCGTPERAAGSGTVISEYYSSVWGNRLYLDLGRINGNNFTVIYNHLNSYRVGTGQHIGRGGVVGYAGTTGWSTGCHLHFTVLVNGNPVDPMHYM
jgi:murein DD-endopeptidase MepM/ murein hydrolase activator NlpD